MKWPRVEMQTVCKFINGGAWSQDEYCESGLPVLKVSNLQKEGIDFSNIDFISELSFSKYKNNRLKAGDLVIATVGSQPDQVNSAAGRTTIIPHSAAGYFLNQNAVCVRTLQSDILDQGYLGYFGKTFYFQHHIQQRGIGAASQMRIAIDAIKTSTLPLPPLPLQRRIAAVLGRYDALLENYQQQVTALEQLAQEVYREWFVRGRGPGVAVDASGELPAGWRVQRLGDVLELKYGKALVAENRVEGEFPVVGSSGIVDWHDEPLVTRPGIVVGRKGNVGSIFWLTTPFYPIDTVFYVESELSSYYLFYNLQGQNFISGDSAVPGLNREQALSNKIVVPDQDSLTQFDALIKTLFKKRDNLQTQITTLRATRDALLPRLLSGQLVINEQLIMSNEQ